MNESRPSLDDRFAVGYCPDGCTPVPVFNPKLKRTQPAKRAVVALIRQDLFDPAALAERRRIAAEQKLVEQSIAGDDRLTPSQRDEAVEIRRRWDREAAERRGSPA